MNRRGFLRLLGMAVASVALDVSLRLPGIAPPRLPKQWMSASDTIALQLEKVKAQLPLLIERDVFDKLLSRRGNQQVSTRGMRIPFNQLNTPASSSEPAAPAPSLGLFSTEEEATSP